MNCSAFINGRDRRLQIVGRKPCWLNPFYWFFMWQIHYRIDVITFYALKPGMHSEMGDALVVTGGASTANRIGIHFLLEQKFGQEET